MSWCVPPQDVRLVDRDGHPATVLDVVHLGAVLELSVELAGGGEMAVTVPAGSVPRVGASCQVALSPESVTVWSRTTTQEILAE